MNRRARATVYLIADIAGIVISWLLIRASAGYPLPDGQALFSNYTLLRISLFVLIWILICSFAGLYGQPYRKSRLLELARSITVTLLFLFLVVIFNNFFEVCYEAMTPQQLITTYFLLLVPTYLPRVLLSSDTNYKIRKGEIGFNTLLIGSGENAVAIWHRISSEPRHSGNRFLGYVIISTEPHEELSNHLPFLGRYADINQIIKEHSIEEVIVAPEVKEIKLFGKIIGELSMHNVLIKSIPSPQDSIITRLRNSEIFGTPLVTISSSRLNNWESNVKATTDIIISFIALILLLPLTITLSTIIFLTDRGPVIYSQTRVGRHGRHFRLLKFRSMVRDAESGTPSLSRLGDPRVTGIGRFMRKHRFDEIPNLINVLLGDMSLIGPRPERPFFVEKIVARAPQYNRLMGLKPGVTSWGQVKYGYASNVDQMIERMEYDLLYLENISLLLDIKIAIYTFIIILLGKGV